MHVLYSILLTFVIVLTLPYWGWRYLATPKYRGTVWQRLGNVDQLCNGHAINTPRVWLHAVSVGETMAASELAKRLPDLLPGHELVVSTVTKTGQEVARQKIPHAAAHCYLPIDLPVCLNPVIAAIRPRLLVVMETELWPGLFRALARRGVPIVLVNGRISPRSFARYRRLRPLMRRVLADGRLYLMQTEADAQRLIAMGAAPQRVVVTGNLKYDQALRPPDPLRLRQLDERLPAPDAPVWIAASTHPGEEEILLEVFARLARHPAAPRLILVPRHPERTPEVAALLRRRQLAFQLFSATRGAWESPVLLVDEIGWLAVLYRMAHLVFIGGTLVPHGGQNMLEAAAWGAPILMGPHTFNFREIAEQLLQAGGAALTRDADALHAMLAALLEAPEQRQRMGEAARSVIPANAGALERTLTAIGALMAEAP
ncbi:MAG: 3-deoxy-D-manno-octulosonic acid transferase [Magnetococcales bacterium]|nr:3-deoxy-D-manno-octulosonic acid transferase [Magnetococcales bacterium]